MFVSEVVFIRNRDGCVGVEVVMSADKIDFLKGGVCATSSCLGSALLVSETDGRVDEDGGVDAGGMLKFPKLCKELGAAPLMLEGFSAPSWRSGEGVGLNVGINDAAAGFNGRSANVRANEGDISGGGGSGAPCVFVWKPLMPLVDVDEFAVGSKGDGAG
jgi:hypothetical protein